MYITFFHRGQSSLLVCILTLLLFCSSLWAKETTILAIGDSITAGGKGFVSYREPLVDLCVDKNLEMEFIGPDKDHSSAHAGYGGKNSRYLRAATAKIYKKYPADIVLIHTGHNHFAKDSPSGTILEDVKGMVQQISELNPKVKILLAKVIPAGKLPKYGYIPKLNRALESAMAAEQFPSNVRLVDLTTGFDWKVHTVADKVHPNKKGAAHMAKVWFSHLLPLLDHSRVRAFDTIPIWPSRSVVENTEVKLPSGRVEKVNVPTLDIYRPVKPNGASILVCSGGGYKRLASGPIGLGAADIFVKRGITVFSLKYSLVPKESVRERASADFLQALRIIRERAKDWKLDPEKVGALGFSAGAHLILSTSYKNHVLTPAKPSKSCPNFIMLASLWQPDYPKLQLTEVSKNFPPTFLLGTEDDKLCPPKQLESFIRALSKQSIPHQVEIYPKGGHMAFNLPSPTIEDWPSKLYSWLDELKICQKIEPEGKSIPRE